MVSRFRNGYDYIKKKWLNVIQMQCDRGNIMIIKGLCCIFYCVDVCFSRNRKGDTGDKYGEIDRTGR